jgi:hypothetical protein
MSAVNSIEFSTALRPGINKWYGDEATALSKRFKDFIPVLYNVENSSKAYEEIAEILGFGLFGELGEGSAIDWDTIRKGRDLKIVNVDFSKGYRVTRKMQRDEQYGLVSKFTKMLARSANKTVRYRAMLPLALGFGAGTGTWNSDGWAATTETYLGMDSKPLFDDAHTLQLTGSVPDYSTTYTLPTTWSNYSSSALAESTLAAGLAALRTQPDEHGFVAGYTANTLVVPSALYYTAQQLVNATATNTVQVNSGVPSLIAGSNLSILEIPELPDTAGWYLLSDVSERDTSVFYWREKPGAPETDVDFNTKDILVSMIFSCSCALGSGKGLYGAGV